MRILAGLERHLRHGAKQMTSSRFAGCWTVIIFAHFFTQIYLRGVTFSENSYARNLTRLCLDTAGVPLGFPAIRNHVLQICDGIPGHQQTACQAISTEGSFEYQPYSPGFRPVPLQRNITVPFDGGEKVLTGKCIAAMQYFHDVFRSALAEDVAVMSFQLWVLVISVASIIHNSIPHLVAGIASHSLDTGWAGYRIKNTLALRKEYDQYAVHSACNGVDILGKWWDVRLSHAVPLFVTNVVALTFVLVIGAALYRRFMGATFSPVGVSPIISRSHKLVLVFSTFLQLSTSFTAMAIGIWIDRIYRGAFRESAACAGLYRAIFVVAAVAIIPWHLTGYFSIRRELSRTFIAFAILHVLILGLWPSMFGTSMYAYAFKTWPFFACVSVASCGFLVAITVAAMACRFSFGRGLRGFLAALSRADLTPKYFPDDGASDTWVVASREIAYPKKTYSIESHSGSLPELMYDSYSGGYTRRPIATSQRGRGFWQRAEGISFLRRVGSRKDQTRGIGYTDYGLGAGRVSQLGEPQFKLPMRVPPQTFCGRRANATSSILTESTTVTQGVVGVIRIRDQGGETVKKYGGVWSLVDTPARERFDQRTPLTTYIIPCDWKTGDKGSTPRRGLGV